MKLVSAEFGQVLQLIVMEEVRPIDGLYAPELYDEITKRYQFGVKPTDFAEAVKTGAKFKIGKLRSGKSVVQIAALEIYNDGVVINARDTKSAETAMDDFLDWSTKKFGLRKPQTTIKRQYASNVVVDLDNSVDRVVRSFDAMTKAYSAILKKSYDWDMEPKLTRLSFGIDPKLLPPQRNSLFFLERRAGQPYTSNRWFAGGPVRTETLLELVTAIEQAAGDEQ